VDSFAGFFDGFYYICTGESTSKADKLKFLRSMQILKTPHIKEASLLHKRDLNSEQTDVYWNNPPEQKGVNLEGLGG